MVLKLVMLGIWMVLVPFGTGYFALGISGKRLPEPGFAFSLGYILMWAVFQLAAVPYIMKADRFPRIVFVFEVISLTLAIGGALLFLLHAKRGLWRKSDLAEKFVSFGKTFLKKGERSKGLLILLLWGMFLAGLLFQMLQAYRLAYADGDDAFYIPISVSAQSDNLYTVNPYTGDSTELNMRYGLAPFPIWVAFIASKCQVNAGVAAHSLIPLVLIPVTYILYLEIGKLLCADVVSGREEKGQVRREALLPLFMIFVTLLQIFGNYSIYPVSTFLLTRTRQGKAALGNVILPFFVLLLYKMAQEVKERGKLSAQNVLWLMAAMTAGCLCSTMAAFLCGMLVMLTAGLIFLLYRRPAVLWQGFLGCVPGMIYALLYLKF